MYQFVQYKFVPFHFYLIMTLVVPCLDNMHIYGFADLCTCNNWCDETYFFGFWFLQGGRGVRACVGMVCYHCIVHIYICILNLSKNSIFFVSSNNLCRAMLPNYLRTYSSALCQIRALKKTFKKQNNAKVYPKSGF